MKRFVGLLSNADAELLESYATKARRILELGVGGSTMIFAQSAAPAVPIVSVDSDPRWIATTVSRLHRLAVAGRVRAVPLAEWKQRWAGTLPGFDLVFVDGAVGERLPFAIDAWRRMPAGGHLLWHDTRNKKDRELASVLQFVRQHVDEVEDVRLNERWRGATSNITTIRKKKAEPWVDWTQTEGKPPWAYGRGEPPASFWRR